MGLTLSELTINDNDFADMVWDLDELNLDELTLDDKYFEPLFRDLDKLNKEFLNGIKLGNIWDNVPRINPLLSRINKR